MGSKFQGSVGEVSALSAYINLIRAADSLTSTLGAHLKEHKLTLSQFGVLEVLLHLGPLSQKEIATKLLMSAGNITMVLDNLEKCSLVKRTANAKDRRTSIIELTPDGKKLISNIFPAHAEKIQGIFSILTLDEQKTIRELCKKLGKQEEKI